MCLGVVFRQQLFVKANQWGNANLFLLVGSHVSDAVHLAG